MMLTVLTLWVSVLLRSISTTVPIPPDSLRDDWVEGGTKIQKEQPQSVFLLHLEAH